MREYGEIGREPNEQNPEQEVKSDLLKNLQESSEFNLDEFETGFVDLLNELEEIANAPDISEVNWSSIQAARTILESLDRLLKDAQADTFPKEKLKTLFTLVNKTNEEKSEGK